MKITDWDKRTLKIAEQADTKVHGKTGGVADEQVIQYFQSPCIW